VQSLQRIQLSLLCDATRCLFPQIVQSSLLSCLLLYRDCPALPCLPRLLSHAASLVHCGAGVSRSACLVMMYLMRSKRWSAQQARVHCIAARSLVCPNDGFWQVLCALEGPLGILQRWGCCQWHNRAVCVRGWLGGWSRAV
jgi:hypothetical protein